MNAERKNGVYINLKLIPFWLSANEFDDDDESMFEL